MIKVIVPENPSRNELQFLGYAGDVRYWPWYLSWLLAPFSPNRKVARVSRKIDIEKLMEDSNYSQMRAEPSTLDLGERVELYHQFQLFPIDRNQV